MRPPNNKMRPEREPTSSGRCVEGEPVSSPTTSHSTASYALRGRIGGLVTQSKYSSAAVTAPARAAFLARFLDAIPHDLPETERLRRAGLARRAYFAKLALSSATVRAKRTRRRGGHDASR